MIFATDLDRTIIHSSKFIKNKADAICVETLDGKEISYMSKRALFLFNELKKKDTLKIIPVTTRSIAQFKRIEPLQSLLFAITSNGGTILYHGNVLSSWSYKIKEIVEKRIKEYEEIKNILDKHKKYLTRVPTLIDDMFFFTKVKEDEKKEIAEILDKELKDLTWEFTIQGTKLYIMPKEISKENALKFLREYLHENFLITAGDGKLDVGFLNMGDKRIVPEKSEVIEYLDLTKKNYKFVPEGMKGPETIFSDLMVM